MAHFDNVPDILCSNHVIRLCVLLIAFCYVHEELIAALLFKELVISFVKFFDFFLLGSISLLFSRQVPEEELETLEDVQ